MAVALTMPTVGRADRALSANRTEPPANEEKRREVRGGSPAKNAQREYLAAAVSEQFEIRTSWPKTDPALSPNRRPDSYRPDTLPNCYILFISAHCPPEVLASRTVRAISRSPDRTVLVKQYSAGNLCRSLRTAYDRQVLPSDDLQVTTASLSGLQIS